jgi:hypothetical protein
MKLVSDTVAVQVNLSPYLVKTVANAFSDL